MDELLRALVQAGIIDQDTADVMRRRLDVDAFRAWAESEMELAVNAGLTAQQARMVEFVRRYDYHPSQARWAAFWQREDALLWESMRTAFTRVGGERQAAAVAQVATSDLTFDLPNMDAREWVNGYYTSPIPLDHGSVPNLDATSREQVRAVFNRWINGDLEGAAAREDGLPALIRALEPTFGPARARRIAVTESTRIFVEGQRQAEADNEFVTMFRVLTARDERVCFPGFTMVSTPSGSVEIKNVKVGDFVLTRNGPRRVTATSERRYSGPMVTIYAGDRAVTSTAGHLFWTVEKGWLEGRNLATGYTLQNVLQEDMNITNILNFNVGHSANHPTVSHEIVGLSGVSSVITVPIDSIDFEGDTQGWEQEVNTIPAHSSFLDVLNFEGIKGLLYQRLMGCFRLGTTVASEAAKLAIRVTGAYSDLLSAGFTVDDGWGSSALLRTVMPVESFFRNKDLSASFARNVFCVGQSALAAANSVPVSIDCLDREVFAALWARFRHVFGGARLLVASPATELTSLSSLSLREVGNLSADRTRYLDARFTERHNSPPTTSMNELYHESSESSIMVYDIQVEEVPEFYANGLLVHNCPICGPLDGQTREKGVNTYVHPELGAIAGPPFHVNCRCGEAPETRLTAEVPLIRQWQWAGAVT